MNDKKKTLYILPNFLGIKHPDAWLPSFYHQKVASITAIFCESFKTAELLISRTPLNDEVALFEINEHTQWKESLGEINSLFQKHQNIGVLSDAGLPGVADPGAKIIALAHQYNWEVEILPGANSMIYALASSGFNGQKFAFKGYLSIDNKTKLSQIQLMVSRLEKEDETQIFMETPYRNVALLNDILSQCPANLELCIACNILDKTSWVKTKSIKEWKVFCAQNDINDYIKKKPVVFVLGKSG